MNEKMFAYVDFAENITESFKQLRQREKLGALAKAVEFRDLSASISGFQETIELIKSGKSVVNPASMYDRTLSIRDLSGNFETPWANQILNRANETLASASRHLTFEETEVHIFNYCSAISDMKFISDAMSELCIEISRNQNRELKNLDEFADTFRDSINGLLVKMKGFFGSVGEDLKGAFEYLAKVLREKIVDKLKDALKKAAELLDKLKLRMLESMFRFVGQVAELAKKNGWTVKEISVELPEIGVKLEKLQIASVSTPIPIPVLQITTPKVSMKFAP